MDVKIFDCRVKKEGIAPELVFEVGIPLAYGWEVPLSISGFLAIESFGKIADLKETDMFHHSKGDYLLYSESYNRNFEEKYWKLKFSVTITFEILNCIENCRMKNSSRDVNFYLKFIGRKLRIEHSSSNPNNRHQYIETNEWVGDFKIPQSKWIENYSNQLGVGKYLLVEFKRPDFDTINKAITESSNKKIRDNFVEVFDKLDYEISEIEDRLRKGDWESVMRHSREFFELLKVGQNNELKEGLKELFLLRNRSDVGFDDFFKSIQTLFDYTSKHIHYRAKQGNNLQVKPIPQYEDAYMAYTLCISLLNLIIHKL